MINYFEVYNLDLNQTREENLKILRAELRKLTKRSNHPKMNIRTKAQEQLKDITAAVEIFENDDSYNRYLTDLNMAQAKSTTPNNYERTESYEQQNIPKDINEILTHADNLIGIDNAKAYDLIQEALSIDSFNITAWELYARYFSAVNKYDEKCTVLDKIENMDPNNFWVMVEQFSRYIDVYPDRGNAKKYYGRIMDQLIEGKNEVSLYYKGRYNMLLGYYEEAISNLLEAKQLTNGQSTINTSSYMKQPSEALILEVNWDYFLSEAYLLAGDKFFKEHKDAVYLTTKEDTLNYIEYMEQSLKYNPNNERAARNIKHGKDVLKKENIMGFGPPLILTAVFSILLIALSSPIFGAFQGIEWKIDSHGLPDFLASIILFIVVILKLIFRMLIFFGIVFIFWFFITGRNIPVYDINLALVKSKNPYYSTLWRRFTNNKLINRISKRDKTKT